MEYGGDGRISEERDGRRGEAGTGDGGGVLHRLSPKRDSTSLEVEDGWYRWQVTIPADVLSERGSGSEKSGEITGD